MHHPMSGITFPKYSSRFCALCMVVQRKISDAPTSPKSGIYTYLDACRASFAYSGSVSFKHISRLVGLQATGFLGFFHRYAVLGRESPSVLVASLKLLCKAI